MPSPNGALISQNSGHRQSDALIRNQRRGKRLYILTIVFFAAGFFSRSSTAATISGRPTVASTKTSPNFPPSAGGTNFPHEIASLYGLPDRPPQYTGSGQMRKP